MSVAAQAGRLRRELSSFGVLLLALSCLSPVFSVYGMGSDVLKQTGSGAALLFLASLAVACVWGAVYAELGSAYPYAGGDYVGVGAILGAKAAFASLTVWAVVVSPYIAFMAKTVAVYVNDLDPTVPPTWVTYAALAAALAVALLGVRTGAVVTGVFLAIELLAVLGLIAAGLWHPARSLGSVLTQPQMLGREGALVQASIGVMALGAVNAAFATTGGNQALAFGEELRDPHRHMGKVVVWACMIGAFATALPVVSAVVGAGDLAPIIRSPAPFSSFVSSVAGPLAGRALSAGVALAVFNALIAQLMFSARVFFSLGRDRIFSPTLNRWLASVHLKSGVPRIATLLLGALSAACCLLDTQVLLIFTAGFTVFAFSLVSAAVLVGRMRRLTGRPGCWRTPLFPLLPVLGLCISFAFLVADLMDADAGRPSILIFSGFIAAALLWYRFVLKPRLGDWTPRLE